jgi:hypothetical protein
VESTVGNMMKGRMEEEVMVNEEDSRGAGAVPTVREETEAEVVIGANQNNVEGPEKKVNRDNSKKDQGTTRVIPRYTSVLQDHNWATSGMVATAVTGDSTLSLQQRVEDAGFNSVVVTPMGSDWVFLHCNMVQISGMCVTKHFTSLVCCLLHHKREMTGTLMHVSTLVIDNNPFIFN